MIKAIKTEYNGCIYRSRLEARWAVFFDSLNINFEYEKEGFEIDGERYLPDFWINTWNCWIEIKPNILRKSHTRLDSEEGLKAKKYFRLCRKLSDNTNNVVLLIGGYPCVEGTESLNNLNEKDRYNFLYEIVAFYPTKMMDSSNFNDSLKKTGFSLKMEDNGIRNRLSPDFYTSTETCSLYWFIEKAYRDNPEYFINPLPNIGDIRAMIEADKTYYAKRHGEEHIHWEYNLCSDCYFFYLVDGTFYLSDLVTSRHFQDKKLLSAYINAKSASFENFY